MDMSKREELYEEQKRIHRKIEEGMGRVMGFGSMPQVGQIAGRRGNIPTKHGDVSSESGEANAHKLAKHQGVKGFSGAFKEQDVEDETVDDLDLGGGEDDLEVPVDDNADAVDDDAQDVDGASEAKLAADSVAQAYLNQLPSDVALESDDNGIVFVEFNDDHHGPFKLALFPADMSLGDVAEVKEPALDDSPLDDEGVEGDLEGEEGELEPDVGVEDDLTADVEAGQEGEEEEELTEVELSKGAKDGIEKPDQVNYPHDDDKRHTVQMKEKEDKKKDYKKKDYKKKEEDLYEDCEDCEEYEDEDKIMEEEEPVLRESPRDRRLRKKGIIGNNRNAGDEEAEYERSRDPVKQGRKDWAKMFESLYKNK